ncbi:MAG: hypothetical protein ACKO24_15970 [Leptolyngbyaceae cyanobacterium]
MKNWDAFREQFRHEDVSTRLGELATNLVRIKFLTEGVTNCDVVEYLLRESKYFIEWIAADIDIDLAAELVELQRLLARWQLRWEIIWADDAGRTDVVVQAQRWFDRLVEMADLLSEPIFRAS